MTKEVLEELILNVNKRTKIRTDILEKDYYVCLVLKELAKQQDELKAYFKGGTALYKILNRMNRFSEDIDLTVKIIETESKTSNKNRLKRSAFDYKIDGLLLQKEDSVNQKGNVIAYYKYDSLFNLNTLFKSGKVQIEATSFTVSEPIEKYKIEPLIYKYATKYEQKVLERDYNISSFTLKMIKLERIFIDKIFALEFYYIRNNYSDLSKHLYDVTILNKENVIKKVLNNKEELKKLINYKREEEKIRKGGIADSLKIKDFSYLKLNFNAELIKSFNKMQKIYILDDEYKITFESVVTTLSSLKNIFEYYNF